MYVCCITVFFSNTNTLEGNIHCDDQVVIILHDANDNESVIQEVVSTHGMTYELRFMACTVDMDGDYKWDGKIY